jgi:hypothetical protein
MNNATLFGALFDMPDDGIYGSNWTDDELDLIVADYFSMLNDEASGVPFNKAQHNRVLRSKIGRSQGSIEFKHQNISAVLQQLGLPNIQGYLPAANYQKATLPRLIGTSLEIPSRCTLRRRPAALWNGPVSS